MAKTILPEIQGAGIDETHDPSTKGLLNHIRDLSSRADNN